MFLLIIFHDFNSFSLKYLSVCEKTVKSFDFYLSICLLKSRQVFLKLNVIIE